MERLTLEEYRDSCWLKIEQYVEGVNDGSIIVGDYIKKIVKKYLRMLNEKNKYTYRTDKVDKLFSFFSFLNVQHKNQYIQFPLLSWQCFFLSFVFGFYYTNDKEKRVVREALLFIGRKSGKTSLAAAVQLFCMLGDNVIAPQSLLLANTAQQASVSLNYAKDIIVHTKELRNRLIGQRSRIVFKDTNKQGFCQVFSSIDPARIEGYSPSAAILDEIHGWEDSTIYQAIKTGIGARINPLILIITTAGSNKQSFCNDYLKYHKNILDNKIEDENSIGFIYQPDIEDKLSNEECWIKANPSLNNINNIEDLRIAFKQAEHSYADQYAFITKHLNIFWDTPDVWIPNDILLPLFTNFEISNFAGKDCYIGIDLSKNTDLTAIVLLFPPDENNSKFNVYPIFFMADRPNNIIRKNGKDLSQWIRQGYIIKCDSKVIDLVQIYDKIIELSEQFNIISISYDKYNAPQVISKLQEKGIECEAFEQNAKRYNAPLKMLESFVYENKINFYDNPALLWMFSNVILYFDTNANIKIIKNKTNDSVDGVVGLGMALGGFIESKYGRELIALQTYINLNKV
jgi:phage terminase large subunit-like protein